MRLSRLISATLAASTLATSCSPESSPPAAVPSVENLTVTPTPSRRESNGVSHEHQFGVVRPATQLSHPFTLRNDTAKPWTFASFRTTCGCTVAEISDPKIPAGGATQVTVDYKAPTSIGDDRRSIGVQLNENDAPAINLVVACKVREPVSLFPILLRVQSGHDKPATAEVEVCCYAAGATTPPTLHADTDWLTIGVPQPLPIPADEPGMVSHWRVPLTLAADRLGPGDYRCELAAQGVAVPVELKVAAPVAVTPGQLFFGTLAVGESKSVTIAVRTPKAHPASAVRCEHDFGERLKIETVSATPAVTILRATFTPTAAGEVSGTVSLRVEGLPATPVPLLARVADAR